MTDIRYGTVRGDCYDFSWLDQSHGIYQITDSSTKKLALCYVGNFVGTSDSGERINLSSITYFVADSSKK